MTRTSFVLFFAAAIVSTLHGQTKYETDTLKSRDGNIVITFLGHGSVMLTFKGEVIYADPVGQYADFSRMPKAGLVLVTHEHGDHLDPSAIEQCRTQKTKIICTEACASKLKDALVTKNGDSRTIDGIKIEAVPAYNIAHVRSAGVPYHPKGNGNGYILTLGSKRIYIAGDTENIPEMSNLGVIDCAFLPMNLPYTMTPEMVAEAAKRIKPKILYPYHFGNTDPQLLVSLLNDEKAIEVRIRKMQ